MPPSSGVEIQGLPRFQATMRAAAADLADLDSAQTDTAQMLLERADVPEDTGELAASGQVQAGGLLVWSAEHAMPLHQGVPSRNIEAHPWAPQAIDANTGEVAEIFTDEITRILSHVKGR